MKDAPMKQQDAATDTPPTELSEPHFDEIAVLIAQPVEPIAQHERHGFAWLEKPRMMIAILVVAGLLGTTALALTFQSQRQPHVDSAAMGIKADESKVDKSEAQPESAAPLGAITQQLKASAPRRRSRRVDAGSKPVARRVGVIVYGGSADRP